MHKSLVVLGTSLGLIVVTGTLAYLSDTSRNSSSIWPWINQTPTLSAKDILLGTSSGFVFGLVDTCLLIGGMHGFPLQRLPYGDDELVRAAYGSAASSFVSAFVSAFIGIVIHSATRFDTTKSPLWCTAVGIVLGSVTAILGSRLSLKLVRQ